MWYCIHLQPFVENFSGSIWVTCMLTLLGTMSYKRLRRLIDGIADDGLPNRLLHSNCFDGLPY